MNSLAEQLVEEDVIKLEDEGDGQPVNHRLLRSLTRAERGRHPGHRERRYRDCAHDPYRMHHNGHAGRVQTPAVVQITPQHHL